MTLGLALSAAASAQGIQLNVTYDCNVGGTLSTPEAPLGNATLTLVSGLGAQLGIPNPLAGRSYVLLRESLWHEAA